MATLQYYESIRVKLLEFVNGIAEVKFEKRLLSKAEFRVFPISYTAVCRASTSRLVVNSCTIP